MGSHLDSVSRKVGAQFQGKEKGFPSLIPSQGKRQCRSIVVICWARRREIKKALPQFQKLMMEKKLAMDSGLPSEGVWAQLEE